MANLPFDVEWSTIEGALHLARSPSIGLPCTVENPDDSLIPASFPNDAFFKEMFSDPPRAIAFFQSHLPPAMAAAADWTSQKLLFVPKTKTNSHEAAKARRNEARYSLFFRGLVTS